MFRRKKLDYLCLCFVFLKNTFHSIEVFSHLWGECSTQCWLNTHTQNTQQCCKLKSRTNLFHFVFRFDGIFMYSLLYFASTINNNVFICNNNTVHIIKLAFVSFSIQFFLSLFLFRSLFLSYFVHIYNPITKHQSGKYIVFWMMENNNNWQYSEMENILSLSIDTDWMTDGGEIIWLQLKMIPFYCRPYFVKPFVYFNRSWLTAFIWLLILYSSIRIKL